MSFPCTRAQGHMQVPYPEEVGPEPCYAQEAARSRHEWSEWEYRRREFEQSQSGRVIEHQGCEHSGWYCNTNDPEVLRCDGCGDITRVASGPVQEAVSAIVESQATQMTEDEKFAALGGVHRVPEQAQPVAAPLPQTQAARTTPHVPGVAPASDELVPHDMANEVRETYPWVEGCHLCAASQEDFDPNEYAWREQTSQHFEKHHGVNLMHHPVTSYEPERCNRPEEHGGHTWMLAVRDWRVCPGGLPEADEQADENATRMPAEWLAELFPNLQVTNDEGWQREDGVTWTTPITRDDFEERLFASSIVSKPPESALAPEDLAEVEATKEAMQPSQRVEHPFIPAEYRAPIEPQPQPASIGGGALPQGHMTGGYSPDPSQPNRPTFVPQDPLAMAGGPHIVPPEPTKTRAEDQVLPSAPLARESDFVALHADITERERIGVSRYGQAHRPFNGRNTLQDAYEETLDQALYLRSLLTQAAADRDQLVQVIQVVLARRGMVDIDVDPDALSAQAIVDSIIGWVAGQRA